MKQLLLVFVGGGIGSSLRYAIGKFITTAENGIPYGTLLANILGSLFIGLILGYTTKNYITNQEYTLLLATGFCGGFTTFSTFSYENYLFLKSGDFGNFAFYTIASFVIAVFAVFAGIYLTKFI